MNNYQNAKREFVLMTPQSGDEIELFARSPVVEALIDIQCSVPEDRKDPGLLSGWQEELQARYPTREEVVAWELGWELRPGAEPPKPRSQGIPPGLSSFLMRLVIPHPDLEATAVLTEAIDRGPQLPGTVSVLFDIDMFREREYEADSGEIWDTLNTLRVGCYSIFVRTLTDKAKELIR
ncbi:MAG: hypothetical protein ACYCW6_19560 [Candidatus Xenobia bacterium]